MAASSLPLMATTFALFSWQTVHGAAAAAAVWLQLLWEQRAGPIARPFVSAGLLPPASRSGGAFVRGEPLIKSPLHPWPAMRWCWGGVKWQLTLGRSAVSEIEALLMSLRFSAFGSLEPGIAGHDRLMMSLPPWHEIEAKWSEPATPQRDKPGCLCSLTSVHFGFTGIHCVFRIIPSLLPNTSWKPGLLTFQSGINLRLLSNMWPRWCVFHGFDWSRWLRNKGMYSNRFPDLISIKLCDQAGICVCFWGANTCTFPHLQLIRKVNSTSRINYTFRYLNTLFTLLVVAENL